MFQCNRHAYCSMEGEMWPPVFELCSAVSSSRLRGFQYRVQQSCTHFDRGTCFAMTMLDHSNDFSPDLSYGLSRRLPTRQPFPFMAAFHFVAVAGVAIVCYVLVH